PAALGGAGARPPAPTVVERPVGGGQGGVDVDRSGPGHLGQHLSRAGFEHLEGGAVGRRTALAGDDQVLGHRWTPEGGGGRPGGPATRQGWASYDPRSDPE